MVERLSVIQEILNSYAITIDKEGASLSLTDFRKKPRICSNISGLGFGIVPVSKPAGK